MNSSDSIQEVTLITGASSGIGLALAREFARHGHHLVIVAPVASELATLAGEISSEFNVRVISIAQDLTLSSATEAILEKLRAERVEVDILVNNAGLGQRGRFWETPLPRDVEMIRLNAEAPVRLTKRFLPGMLQRQRGRILNTASIAGFEPGPLLAVYHASKAFLLSWSEALATELENTGVTVTALCPGPVDTDFFSKADMLDTTVFQKGHVMGPRAVAEAGYAALMRGERVIVPGAINKAMVFSRRLMPESAQAKMNEKYYEDADLEHRNRERGDIERQEKRDEVESPH